MKDREISLVMGPCGLTQTPRDLTPRRAHFLTFYHEKSLQFVGDGSNILLAQLSFLLSASGTNTIECFFACANFMLPLIDCWKERKKEREEGVFGPFACTFFFYFRKRVIELLLLEVNQLCFIYFKKERTLILALLVRSNFVSLLANMIILLS